MIDKISVIIITNKLNEKKKKPNKQQQLKNHQWMMICMSLKGCVWKKQFVYEWLLVVGGGICKGGEIYFIFYDHFDHDHTTVTQHNNNNYLSHSKIFGCKKKGILVVSFHSAPFSLSLSLPPWIVCCYNSSFLKNQTYNYQQILKL